MSTFRKIALAYAAFALAGTIADICVHKYANAAVIGIGSIIACIFATYPEEER